MKNKRLGYAAIVMSALLMAGCGSNDKPDGNPVTSGDAGMSITPVEVEYSPEKGCKMLFRAHAVEGNGNPIPGLGVGASVVINTKASGTGIGMIETTAPISFVDNRLSFNAHKVARNDKLIILPSAARHDTSYIGDWTVYQVDGSRVTLAGAAYNLETTDQLSYVIGNETAYVGTTAVAHVESVENNGTTLTDEKGYAYFYVIYDTELIGQPYVVGAHTGDGYRMGAAWAEPFPSCISIPNDNTNNPPADSNSTPSCSAGKTCPGTKGSTCTSGTCPDKK